MLSKSSPSLSLSRVLSQSNPYFSSHTGMASSSSSSPPVVLLLVFVFMVASVPLARASSSHPRVASDKMPLSSSMDEEESDRQSEMAGVGGIASAAFDTEDSASAREVPMGPNPLHHNHNPITKPRKGHAVIATRP